jgi:aminopeptidase N
MVAVQPFTYGGMEHQTMTTINRSWLSGNRRFEYGIAHELAHQWWGDMVTLSDFRHVWLNEGFATYAEDIFAENFYGRSTFETRMANLLQTYFYYDEHVGRFPLFDPWAYFNGAEYYKGGLILHMLRGIIGDDNFFTGMRHYATLYKYGNASTEDFRDAMEAVSGVDLDYFFQEWIYEQGYPEYQYAWQSEPFGDHYRVNFQLVQIQQNAPIFSMPIQLLISTTSGDTLVTIFSSQQNELFQIEVTNQPNAVQFDPNNWLIKKSQLTNIELPVNHPIVYQLNQNYPNPFNSHTTISLMVPREGQVRLDVFDIGGRLVKTLVDNRIQAGEYTYNWDGTNQSGLPVAGGVYLYKMTSDGYQMTRKLTYLK